MSLEVCVLCLTSSNHLKKCLAWLPGSPTLHPNPPSPQIGEHEEIFRPLCSPFWPCKWFLGCFLRYWSSAFFYLASSKPLEQCPPFCAYSSQTHPAQRSVNMKRFSELFVHRFGLVNTFLGVLLSRWKSAFSVLPPATT